jgi:hypothetical protein
MPSQTQNKNQGVVRSDALRTIHQLRQLEYVLLGNVLTDRALREVPGIEHIPAYSLHNPLVIGARATGS